MKYMKYLSLVLLVMALLVMTSLVALGQDEPTTLVVSTFGFNLDVIEENVTQGFEEMYGVDVIYDTGNNSDRLAKLESQGADSEIDVVHFAGAFTFRAKEAGLLQAIDPGMLENYEELYDFAKDPLGDNAGIAYAVNSYRLIYRSDLIEEPITSWADLLREDVAGFVSVPDISTTFGPATIIMLDQALMGGISGGGGMEVEPEATEEAMDDMAEDMVQLDYDAVLGWEALPDLAGQLVTPYIRSSELTTLVQEEEVWLAPYGSFAIGNLLGTGHTLTAVTPVEGAIGDPIVVSITAATDKVELAHAYIDWLISNEVQTAEALDLIDSPTNSTVEVPDDVGSLLTYGEEFVGSLIFLDQSEVAARLDDWIERWNEIMLQ